MIIIKQDMKIGNDLTYIFALKQCAELINAGIRGYKNK